MIKLELTETDAARLRALCEEELSSLRMEIAGTDSRKLRENLKENAQFLTQLIERLAVVEQHA